jgi:hypothetical protein
MDDLSDTSLECERREDRSKANSMVQLMSHIQVELSPPANPTCRPKNVKMLKEGQATRRRHRMTQKAGSGKV